MDVFEDKESTESGSPVMGVGGGADGSGVVPQVMNRAVSMSMEKSLGVVTTAPGGGGGGGASGGEGEGAIVATGVLNSGGSDLMNSSGKKKRGRPRKYDSDGNLRVPYIAAAAAAAGAFGSQPQPTGFTLTTPPGFSSTPKRGRGRPAGSASGSGNWKSFASSLGEILANTAGGDFTPHVVTVYAGEDVAGKILSFAQTGSRGLCVLSANGSVSNATIRQPGSSGGILTYEGRFEILSLTGSFTTSENGGIKSRTGGLSVSLAGPDGRVIGGGVAGLLMAASPIQVVLGSFMPNSFKTHKRKYNTESRVSNVARPIQAAAPDNNACPAPPSQLQAASQEETDKNPKEKDNLNPTPTESAHWNGSAALNLDQRPSPDINLSVSIEQQQ